jgi:ribonuclease HII
MGALLRCERALWSIGVKLIAGVDEVGVGPLAGPVIAAAVVLPESVRERGVDDSKRLTALQREDLAQRIQTVALAIGIGRAEVEEIDRLNIYHAALLAMRRAVEALPLEPERILVDARTIPGLAPPQTPMIKGDQRSYSIAAASIIAKVTRDALMAELDATHPNYGFARHMGYATAEHLSALERYGPCPIHRRSFSPVRQPGLPGIA